MRYIRIPAEETIPTGQVVFLLQGQGDQRRLVEWFLVDERPWVCPETTNGYWYATKDPGPAGYKGPTDD